MVAALILTTAPSVKEAQRIAEALLKKKLCACVSWSSKTKSMFFWSGKLQKADEVQLFIKAPKNSFEKIKKEIIKIHSYEVPEIIEVPVSNGEKKYIAWVNSPR